MPVDEDTETPQEELNEHGDPIEKPRFTQDTPQGIYDDEFDKITGHQQPSSNTKDKSSSPDKLKSAEEGASTGQAAGKQAKSESGKLKKHEGQIGDGYNDDDQGSKLSRLKRKVSSASKKKKAIIGGGVGAGIGGILIGSFMSMLPLKVNHIAENLQKRHYASSESAVEKRAQKMFSDYIRKHLIPSMKGKDNCNSTLTNKDCVHITDTDTPAKRLYKAWADNRFENKLATNHGLKFEKTGAGVKMFVKGDKNGIDLSEFINNSNLNLDEVAEIKGRANIRTAIKDAFKDETHLKRMMYRFKVGRFLERKYGIRRCLFFCKTTDKLDDWKDKKKLAARMMIIKRVVMPHNDLVQEAMQCIMDSSCVSGDTDEYGDDNEKKRDALEKKIAERRQEFGGRHLSMTVAEVADEVEDIMKASGKYGGLGKYFADKAVDKVFTDTAVAEGIKKATGKVLPVVGWIDFAANIIKFSKDSGAKVKRWAFAITGASMVTTYMLYRSHADELKNAKIDVEMLGGTVDTISDAAGNDQHRGQSAEVSPLYDHIMATPTTKTAFMDILSPTAYAQGKQAKYTCDDNNPIPAGQLICDEEKLIPENFATKISDLFKSEPLATLGTAADWWSSSIGWVINGISGAIGDGVTYVAGLVPGYDELQAKIREWTSPLIEKASKYIIPQPIYDGMSGARTFNMAAGGADVSANDYAHYGLGGKKLSDEQVAALRTEQLEQENLEFANKSIFARLFDKEDSRSMVSQLAMSMPLSASRLSQSTAATLLSNPISQLRNGFGSLFITQKTKAAVTADPFGVPQYGYPVDDPVFKADSDQYTDAYCDEKIKAWAESATQNPDTGLDEHGEASPCLLERAAAGSAGGKYSTDVLQPEDLQDPGGGGGEATGGGEITGDHAALVDRLFKNPLFSTDGPENKTDLSEGGKCIGGEVGQVTMSDNLIKLLISLMENTNTPVRVSSTVSDHKCKSASGNISNHSHGKAVDIGNEENADVLYPYLYQHRAELGIDELIFSINGSQNEQYGGHNLKHGQHHNYSSGVTSGHDDHIHVSVEN